MSQPPVVIFPSNPMLFIPSVFEDCFTVQTQIAFLYREHVLLEARVAALEARS